MTARTSSDPAAPEARLRTVVVGVVEAALREQGARGIVLTGPEGPERRLLRRWLGEGAVVPDEAAVERCREGLAAALPEAPAATVEGEARRAVARTVAGAQGLLEASEIHKTALVTAPGPPPERLLPLGDVWASQVLAVAGDCTVPAGLEGLGAEEIGAVDAALRAHLEEGRRLEEAVEPLEPVVRERLVGLLRRRPWGRFRVPLVPKLGPGTVGVDLE